MKTGHLFDEYYEFLDNQQTQLKVLKAEANELSNSIKANEQQYKEHISAGEDKKADKAISQYRGQQKEPECLEQAYCYKG